MGFLNDMNIAIQEQLNSITISSFLSAVGKYPDLDSALTDLPQEYLEFYVNNEKKLRKAINNLFESAEDPGYVKWSPPEKTIVKIIKYKGNLIKMEFDPQYRVWDSTVVFRSVTEALRFGKKDVDDNT